MAPSNAAAGLELAIFLANGKLFYFYDVAIVEDVPGKYIHFTYFGQKSIRRKQATFFYNHMVGISVSLKEEPK